MREICSLNYLLFQYLTMKRKGNLYHKITEWNNLIAAFYNAARGKRLKPDVLLYEKNLYTNLKTLQNYLINQTVLLGSYRFFKIYDPKERLICAAPFNERVLHFILFIQSLVILRQIHTPPSDRPWHHQRPSPSCGLRAGHIQAVRQMLSADLAQAPQSPSAPARTCAPRR